MNKYYAKKTACLHGHKHDSKAEAERCNELHLMQKSGEISDLKTQVPFLLLPAMKYKNMPDEKAITYKADFVYTENGITVIEDVKGKRTREYINKRKQLKALYCTDEKTVFIEYIRRKGV